MYCFNKTDIDQPLAEGNEPEVLLSSVHRDTTTEGCERVDIPNRQGGRRVFQVEGVLVQDMDQHGALVKL